LESDVLRVVVVPALGAKIVSLFDKRVEHEWLVAPMRPLQPVAYGSRFIDQDMSGWDECLPTINACPYPAAGPFAGAGLPDHGEVWALPWRPVADAPDALALAVNGRALPYRFQRTIRFAAPDSLQFDYRITNTGGAAVEYLWAAHPQFTCDEETTIVLPPAVTEVYNVVTDGHWGAAGQRYPWPVAFAQNGERYQLDCIGAATRHDCRKFYLPPESSVTWATLVDYCRGFGLRMTWNAAELPYLGIWVDEGAINRVSTVALEPTNGFYDSLTIAHQNGQMRMLEAGETQRWQIGVILTTGEP
jgi:galactose mutarotase-like enzyme